MLAFSAGRAHASLARTTCRRVGAEEAAFITLHGIAAFIGGAALIVISLIVAFVQIGAVVRRRELLRFFPPAIGATAVGVLAGLYLMLGAEFGWVSPALLDDLALPVIAAASWWMFYNRMSTKRNRLESR